MSEEEDRVVDEQWRTRRGGVETSLRTSAVWAAVHDIVERRAAELGRPLRVLDLGGGTGGLAVPIAELGHDVTVVDPSPDALASLSRRSGERGVAARVHAVQGDADSLAGVVGADPVDLVCCHGTLEVVDDPQATLSALADVLAPGGSLSLVAAQRLAVVLARALAGQFAQAEQALTSADGRWGSQDPLPRRFDADALRAMVEQTGLVVDAVHGVRTFSDLVPSALVDTDADRVALLRLEQAVADSPQFAFLGQLGSAVHVLAHR
ncbi:methyltransferase domain-containing protein [Phycicoccus sp. M110.8]|uniref:methyltransferase domain-containing protein n=1 Tax=Phycicoccus sp. M110.8 TaxID=3075433 RepID=UPI0028FD8D3A|nr:methyltransferase domain-containing protein [Phycicoccus sp. M110.8]MDU0315183.1 methyltransferase domain-containing protein [Phycicoccus sp. M110.8]HET8765781.1 methyltransferase domain-containing protein [Pedococcus sp.]